MLWVDKHRASADVRAIAEKHIVATERKQTELEGMRAILWDHTERGHGDDHPDFPILDELVLGPPAEALNTPPSRAQRMRNKSLQSKGEYP